MRLFIGRVLISLLLLSATQAYARDTFFVSPSAGKASVSNIDGFTNSDFSRVDAAYYPLPELGFGLFGVSYSGFKTGSGNPVEIKVRGRGPSVTGRWPIHPYVQPYVRLDYMMWNAESSALGRTLAKQSGASAGLALGVHFPIWQLVGIKAELSGYNKVSDANIRQFSVGLTFEF